MKCINNNYKNCSKDEREKNCDYMIKTLKICFAVLENEGKIKNDNK